MKDDDKLYDKAYKMTLDIWDIFINNNTLNNIGDAYFPDTEIACYLCDKMKGN